MINNKLNNIKFVQNIQCLVIINKLKWLQVQHLSDNLWKIRLKLWDQAVIWKVIVTLWDRQRSVEIIQLLMQDRHHPYLSFMQQKLNIIDIYLRVI